MGTRPLGQILLEAGLVTPEVIREALARAEKTRERIGEALIALGAVAKEDVLRALATQQDLPFLSREELPSLLPILKNLSPKYLRQYRVCPVALDGSTLTLATADPTNPLPLDDLRQSLGLQIRLAVAPEEAILEAIERTYGSGAASPLLRIVEGISTEGAGGEEGEEDVSHLRDLAFEAPVVRLVNLLIETAVAQEA